jgi:hypothetical protein
MDTLAGRRERNVPRSEYTGLKGRGRFDSPILNVIVLFSLNFRVIML